MKKLIIILFVLSSCHAQRFALGADDWRVTHVDRNSGVVTFTHYMRQPVTIAWQCLPDSIQVGKIIKLPKN